MKNIPLMTGLLILMSMPFYFSSCKDDDVLPSLTTEGKNTFGCKVNGNLWLPTGRFGQPKTSIEMTTHGDTVAVSIQAQNFGTYSGFTLSVWDFQSLKMNKSYDLINNYYYAEYYDSSDGLLCGHNNVICGYVKFLKYDIENRIIAGTFEFTAGSAECSDTVKVTEGRFDIGEITRY